MNINQLRASLRADLRPDTERGRLIRTAGATAAIKVGGTLVAFGASLLYARVLGPHDYGLYAYVIAWVAVLTIPASLGLPQYLVREGAKAPAAVRQLRGWADRRIILSGLAAAVLMACAVFLPQAAGARWLFVIAAPLPILNSAGSVRSALLQARGQVARSQWPALLLAPALALSLIVGLWVAQGLLLPAEVIGVMTAAAVLPLIINELQLQRTVPESGEDFRKSHCLRAAMPFMWLGGLYLLNNRVDLIMLGAFKGAHDAGIYSVAARAAELITFFLVASNMVIAPRIARLYHDGRKAVLQRMLTAAARRVLILSIPIALLFIVAAHPLLEYLYGIKYGEGAIALQVLAGAQFVNVVAGPTGTILNMTGRETLATIGLGISLSLNIALNVLLIPTYGIEGAAVATGASMVAWNGLLWHWTRSRLHLCPTALGI